MAERCVRSRPTREAPRMNDRLAPPVPFPIFLVLLLSLLLIVGHALLRTPT